MLDVTVITLAALAVVAINGLISVRLIRSLQSTIDRQNDTIQRMLNREPVTYQETGQKQPKIIEEAYSAWGSVTVDREVRDD